VSDLGPVSASLYAELRELARQRGIVVWLDKEGSYTAFADALAARSAADPTALPVRRFRGSYLELMLALEDVQDGVAMTPLLIHVPGHNEDSIAETPLFEVYRAGRRHRHALDTLVRDAAHGLATPAAIDAFLATPGFTLDDADRWLARQVAGAAAGAGSGGPDLSLHTAEALYDDLVSRGPVARELERPEAVAAVWRRAEVLLGLTEDARRQLLVEAEGSARRASSPAELASDAATALAGWALCVEFVHDLRRAPADPWLAIAQHLPKAAVAACQKLAVHLRRRHDRQYASIAASVEDLVPLEVATATADDLGKIDTFEFEDAKVLAAALDALMIADNQRALALATARTSGKSFWTTYDPRRRIAWHLIELAARLGSASSTATGSWRAARPWPRPSRATPTAAIRSIAPTGSSSRPARSCRTSTSPRPRPCAGAWTSSAACIADGPTRSRWRGARSVSARASCRRRRCSSARCSRTWWCRGSTRA
jgi:hypothetical protein